MSREKFATEERRPKDPLFGNRIRQRRRGLGLTQAGLADKVGVVVSAINSYEAGRLPGDPRIAVRLAKELGVDLERLLMGVGYEEPKEAPRRAAERVRGYKAKRQGPESETIRTMIEEILASGNPKLIKALRQNLQALQLAFEARPPEVDQAKEGA